MCSRLLENDPLRMRERSALRLRERWFLIEPDRAFARSAAEVALGTAQDGVPDNLERWALGKIDRALDQILEADRQAELAGEPLEGEPARFQLLTDNLLIDPARVRSVTVAFHALEDVTRRAFFELFLEGRELLEVLADGPWDADELHEHVVRCLRTFGYAPPAKTRNLALVYPKPGKESP